MGFVMQGLRAMLASLAAVTVVVAAAPIVSAQDLAQADMAQADAGKSHDAAIPIGSIAEEYAWIEANRAGWAVDRQGLMIDGDRAFDALTISNGDRTETIVFDITSFFGR